MSVRLFGTDGMRGRVNKYPMTPEVALRLGLAAGTFYRDKNRRSRVVIGKDTRLSGYVFENALAAGLLAAGMDVFPTVGNGRENAQLSSPTLKQHIMDRLGGR